MSILSLNDKRVRCTLLSFNMLRTVIVLGFSAYFSSSNTTFST